MISCGIDYSTANIGVSIVEKRDRSWDLHFATTISLGHIESHSIKRIYACDVIGPILREFNPELVLMERIRLFKSSFISFDAIVRLSAIFAAIVDLRVAPVYSADTNSIRKNVLGRAKATKEDVVDWVNKKWDLDLSDKKHDLADSIVIAEAPFYEPIWRSMKLQS